MGTEEALYCKLIIEDQRGVIFYKKLKQRHIGDHGARFSFTNQYFY